MILDKPRVRCALAALLTLWGCSGSDRTAPQASTGGLPVVVVTTSTLASLVAAVGDRLVDIRTVVPIGASPETYEPVPRDVMALERASLVIENGAGLEAWLSKLLANAPASAKILVLSHGLPANVVHAGSSQFSNPHFWLDPRYAALYVDEIAGALSALDPRHAPLYHANAALQARRLAQLDAWIRKRIATIPADHRAMITDHDAWYYFDRRYGIEDVGAIEETPGKEPSAAWLAQLIAKAKARHVRAVFAEPEFSPKLAAELADNAGITTITDLYDDSLGTTPQLSSYQGMMRHDVDSIVQALRS